MEKFFIGIYDYFRKNRMVFFTCLVLIFLLTGWFAINLKFKEGISNIFINSDFSSIAWLASISVFTMLLLTYGRIELALVSIIPASISFIGVIEIMRIFGIRFNITSIIVPVSIFGPGGFYSHFIMHGLLEEYKSGKKNLSPNKSFTLLLMPAIVAALIVLIFSKYPGLKSIALVSIVGFAGAAVLTQILIPSLFSFLIKNRVKKKLFPWTALGLFKSIFSFSYFVIGSIILTIFGLVVVRLNPFNKEKGKYLYHAFLSKYCWSLTYIMSNVKKRIVNPQNENFSKPAFIVCNHQSFLDILSTVMLHPKLILFTNHWVWNSPVFGAVVRMADYYPIMYGAESSYDLLAEKIKQGYSVVVFPEGTRSVDGTMKRFHKGAFFLAEKLQVDILPIIIHGSGYTMTKGDFLLKDGIITLKFLPRIKPADHHFGTNYTDRAKLIGRYCRQEFNKLKHEIEQPSYFKEQLKYNYIYKGPVIEWYMRIKLRLEKNYKPFHELLPVRGKLLDIGCGYGFMSYMLHFAAPQREITGIDYDEEKTILANHCFSRDNGINFICADADHYAFEKYDGIILSDVLHYLQPEQQKAVIEKCIDNLNPEGTIVIREGDIELGNKHAGTRLTEYLSTRMFGFNKTSAHGLSFLSGETIRKIAAEKNIQFEKIDRTKYTSNVIFVMKRTTHTIHEQI